MLNKPALDLLTPANGSRKQVMISVDNGYLVIQFAEDGWIALTRDEGIKFVQMVADRLNGMVN